MFCDPCSEKLRIVAGKLHDSALSPPISDAKISNQKISGTAPTKVINDEFHDRRATDGKMSVKYPKYYKEIPNGVTELDIYMVCNIFQIQDASGALHHAIKKILLPGVRTGGKSRRDDIKEARDTLTRWLDINK